MTEKTKVKRKLSNVDFTKDGAHLALVSKEQGHGANGHHYALIMKANFSEEFVKKVQQVKVTLDLPEFLRKFFGLWSEDSEVLASLMGYVKPESTEELYDYEKEYKDYITSKVNSFELIKSLHEAKNLPKAVSELTEEQYFNIIQDQEIIEKALLTEESSHVAKDTKTQEVSTSVIKQNSKETKMEENQVEMVEKSALAALQKALDDQAAELQKARDLLIKLEEEKVVAKAVARKAEVVAAIKDEAKAEVLFKAVKDASDEDFQAVVKALSEINALVEKSALFIETGAAGETEPEVKESAVAKAVKANLKK